MNKHAKKMNEDMLQRWSPSFNPSFKLEDEDGNEVEVEGQDVGRLFWWWRDANPMDYKPRNRPESQPDLWRVKPKKITEERVEEVEVPL